MKNQNGLYLNKLPSRSGSSFTLPPTPALSTARSVPTMKNQNGLYLNKTPSRSGSSFTLPPTPALSARSVPTSFKESIQPSPDVMLYSRPLHWCADTDARTPFVLRTIHYHAGDCGLAYSKTPRTPAEDASGCPKIDMTYEEYQERNKRHPARPLISREKHKVHSKYLDSSKRRNNSPLDTYQRPTSYARRGNPIPEGAQSDTVSGSSAARTCVTDASGRGPDRRPYSHGGTHVKSVRFSDSSTDSIASSSMTPLTRFSTSS